MKIIKTVRMSFLVFVMMLPMISSVFVPSVSAADDVFYVSDTNGDDTNNTGTSESPFKTIEKALSMVGTSGDIVLLSDVTLTQTLTINASGKTITIKSAEGSTFSIIRDASFASSSLIQSSGGNITFDNVTIDGNNVSTSKLYEIYVSGGNVFFKNSEIKNHIVEGSGSAHGGVVFSTGNTTVTIQDGTKIYDNRVMGTIANNPPSLMGAGTGGKLVIEGGIISGNEISSNSNGVIVGIGSASSPRFRMTGGEIKDNKLLGTETDETGQTIGNVAVFMRGQASQARFDFGGTAYVYNNLNSSVEQRNVFLKNIAARNSAYLTLIGAMEPGSKVGVYANIMPNDASPIVDLAIGADGYTASVTDSTYFVSDKTSTAAVAYEEGTKKIVLTPVDLKVTQPTDRQIVSTTPTVNGLGTPGATVKLKLVSASDPSAVIEAEVTVKDDGTWSFTPSTKLKSGDYILEATLVKNGVTTVPLTLGLNVVDTEALQTEVDLFNGLTETDYTPESWAVYKEKRDAALAVLGKEEATQAEVNAAREALETARNALEDSFSESLKITAPESGTVIVRKPEIKGTVEPGSEVAVVIKDAQGNEVPNAGGPATVDDSGNWSFTPGVDLEDGGYTVEVTAVKGSKEAVETKTLTVSATNPELTIIEPSGEKVTVSNPEIKGIAEPDAQVTVDLKDESGNVIDTFEVEVDSNGNWSFIPSKELPDGQYTVDARAVKDGKVSTASKTFVVDTSADKSPLLTNLELKDSNGAAIGLSPAFNENTYSYTAYTVTNGVYLIPTLDSLAGMDPNAKIEISLNGGTWIDAVNAKASDSLSLNEGKNEIVVQVTANGRTTSYTLTVTRQSSTGGNTSGGSTSAPEPTTPSTAPVPKDNLVTTLNGGSSTFATSKKTGDKQTAVQVDANKLIQTLTQGTGQQLAIHSPNEGDLKVDGLTADTLKQLADKGASLDISNPLAIYPVPGGKMDLNGVSKQLGDAALNDIAVHVGIARSSATLIDNAKNKAAAGGYELLTTPVDLDLTFTKDGNTVRSGQLNGYAKKYIALPEGIDPNRITTGVVINPDGSVFHVPTVVTKIDNRYYALINDLRSSGTYSVIWNPQDFEDVRYHWGRGDVNNIAARLDLKGNGDNTFSPNRSVTRSEFAEIVVTGLGLKRQDAPQANFYDVPTSVWYKDAVAIANEFDIVRGYDDGNFKGDQQITREQGFAMIARAYRLVQSEAVPGQETTTATLARYADGANVSAWAKADVAQLITAGIIQGNGPEVLSPKAQMTRAEVAALVARMLKVTNLIDK
ncbi:S-layer homology domain-containing protein [Paenibacillus cellulositrophicus]|uniref:S-layer homology domain-containing protein n=1 Tax=Paenibacillus cellulositrophicus TaxID=562959 RepID=UPI001267188D|nr:S-layer homology domain-containing protein [Paenibacillus cellulositrophicus]